MFSANISQQKNGLFNQLNQQSQQQTSRSNSIKNITQQQQQKSGGLFGSQSNLIQSVQGGLFKQPQTQQSFQQQSQQSPQQSFLQQQSQKFPQQKNTFTQQQQQQNKQLFPSLTTNQPQTQQSNLFKSPLILSSSSQSHYHHNQQQQQNLSLKQYEQLITQFKKDIKIHKQTTQKLLKMITDLETKNKILQQKYILLQEKNNKLQTQMKLKQQQLLLQQQYITTNKLNDKTPIFQPLTNQNIFQQQQQQSQNLFLQQKQQNQNNMTSYYSNLLQKIQTMPQPLIFSPKNNLFSSQKSQARLFSQQGIQPKAFTQKTFKFMDNYSMHVYIAFNAFYQIKYIIIQSIQNQHGKLILKRNQQSNKLFKQSQLKGQNWYLFHQNNDYNLISRQIIPELTKYIMDMFVKNINNLTYIPINLSKYIEIDQKCIKIYNSEWNINNLHEFEIQIYNLWGYNHSNNQIKSIILNQLQKRYAQQDKNKNNKKDNKDNKDNIDDANRQIQTKQKQFIGWIDQKNGIFHFVKNNQQQ